MKALAVLLLALIAFPAARLAADPLILRAQAAEKEGQSELAARTYLDWLHAHPGAAGAASVFASYRRTESDLSALIVESREFLVAARGKPGAAEEFARIARLFELAGLVEEARDAWISSWKEGSQGSALAASALLSLELNDAAALAAARDAAAGGPFESLIAGLAAIQAGDYDSARVQLARARETSSDPDVALKALWMLYRVSLIAENAAAATSAAGNLSAGYAGSPEAAMAAGGRSGSSGGAPTVVFPSAFEILGGASNVPAPAAAAASGPSQARAVSGGPASGASAPAEGPAVGAQPASFAVQAGSFQVRENADDLAGDLRKKGFEASVVQDTWQGKDRFRVLAGSGLTRDAAKTLLAKLTDAGFSGFVIPYP
jgi:cell division septation protein DedD